MIKFQGKVLSEVKVASYQAKGDWNNSMGDYYPILWVNYWSEADQKPMTQSFSRSEYFINGNDPSPGLAAGFEITIDTESAQKVEAYYTKIRQDEEAAIIKKGRTIKVVRGRKVPIGTVGVCFWVGDTKFGRSVGIILPTGVKTFTSARNVEVEKAS